MCFAIILGQQPFMMKAKGRQRVIPLQLAISGMFYSPDVAAVMILPSLQVAVNSTSRLLLTPLEYLKEKPSRRTVLSAYHKTERLLSRIAHGNSSMAYTAEVVARPMPNIPLLGAWILVCSSFAALLLPGAEVLMLAGCGCLFFGCSGMQSQPELLVVAALAVLGMFVKSHASAPARITVPKSTPRRRRPRSTKPKSCCGEPAEDPMPARMRGALNGKAHAD